MKIYYVDNEKIKDVKQLIRLNSECVRLHWSSLSKNIPTNVLDSIVTIEDYVVNLIPDICNQCVGNIPETEEEMLIEIINKEPSIKDNFGTGVICYGTEADSVRTVLDKYAGLEKVKEALNSGNNVVFF